MMKILFTFFILLPVALFSQADTTVVVFFQTDSYQLTSHSRSVLEQTLDWMNKNEVISVTSTGYCDDRASNDYNQRLSEKRASEVGSFLTERNNMDVTVNAGGELPLTGSETAENERSNNRRVELLINYQTGANHYHSDEIDIDNTETTFTLDNLEVGDKVVLENILFEGGRHYLLPESYAALDTVTAILVNNTKYEFAILGHVCCTPYGEDGLDIDTGIYNLSEARAQVIYDYLVKHGVKPERLTHEGFGGNFPLGGEDKYDRRVEIEITGIIE